MTKRILIAYDGSESADKAFEFALDFTERYQGELYVLSVIRLPEPHDDIETEAFIEQANKQYHGQFAHLQKRAHAHSFPIHFKSVIGHSTEQILRQAEELKIDHIIVGSQGKGFFQRILLGSVSKQVMIYAPCSVTVVR